MRDANVAMKGFLKAASSLLTGLQKPLRSQRLSKLTQVAAKNLLETISWPHKRPLKSFSTNRI